MRRLRNSMKTAALTPPFSLIMKRMWPRDVTAEIRIVHKYVDIQAAYLRDGLWKKDRIFSGLRCKESIDDFTLLLKSSRLMIEVRPTVSALRCFHTSSSGFLSGE